MNGEVRSWCLRRAEPGRRTLPSHTQGVVWELSVGLDLMQASGGIGKAAGSEVQARPRRVKPSLPASVPAAFSEKCVLPSTHLGAHLILSLPVHPGGLDLQKQRPQPGPCQSLQRPAVLPASLPPTPACRLPPASASFTVPTLLRALSSCHSKRRLWILIL